METENDKDFEAAISGLEVDLIQKLYDEINLQFRLRMLALGVEGRDEREMKGNSNV